MANQLNPKKNTQKLNTSSWHFQTHIRKPDPTWDPADPSETKNGDPCSVYGNPTKKLLRPDWDELGLNRRNKRFDLGRWGIYSKKQWGLRKNVTQKAKRVMVVMARNFQNLFSLDRKSTIAITLNKHLKNGVLNQWTPMTFCTRHRPNPKVNVKSVVFIEYS